MSDTVETDDTAQALTEGILSQLSEVFALIERPRRARDEVEPGSRDPEPPTLRAPGPG